MSKLFDEITVTQAREKAVAAVLRDLSHYESKNIDYPLEEEFLEAEHCWFFFRKKAIVVMPEHWFTKTYDTFAISKDGAFSQVTTLGFDDKQVKEYLQTMSNYFGQHRKN